MNASILFSALLFSGAMLAGRGFQRGCSGWATLLLFLAVAVPSTLQMVRPEILVLLMRDPAAVAAGQLWRILSANFVQDGGVAGTVFNLVSLGLIAPVAERTWGAARTIAIFFVCGIAFNAVGVFLGSTGAGNSGATFALAASVGAAAILRHTPGYIWGALCLIAGIGLMAIGDIHWVGIAAGTAAALVLVMTSQIRSWQGQANN